MSCSSNHSLGSLVNQRSCASGPRLEKLRYACLSCRIEIYYTEHMSDATVLVLVLVIGLPIFAIVRYWYRRRQAGKLADDLLKDVLKGKDAFRR